MLSEEEKQAIKTFKSYINAIDTFGTIDYKCINNLYEPVKIVLNLMVKLQKENKKLKDKNQDLLRKLRNRVKEVKKLTKYSLYKKEFSRLNKVIKEKDKQIDLMVEYINNIRDCPLENCGADLDCENRCDNNEELTKQCWKMYFESKSKEE